MIPNKTRKAWVAKCRNKLGRILDSIERRLSKLPQGKIVRDYRLNELYKEADRLAQVISKHE